MPTPSYSAIISGIVTRLQTDNRLDGIIEDEFIYYGGNIPQIHEWPAVTVELQEVEEVWRTFGGTQHGRKDALVQIGINVYDQQMEYVTGLNSVEDKVRVIENVLRSDLGVSGNAYYSETTTKRFGEVLLNNVPAFAAEITFNAKIRFTQS